MKVHLGRKVQIAFLITDKAPVTVLKKYSAFIDVSFKKFITVLPKHTKINTNIIDLEEGKQPFYSSIYSLRLIELETLKTYNETNLVNGFICPFKFSTNAPIFFGKKPNKVFSFISII